MSLAAALGGGVNGVNGLLPARALHVTSDLSVGVATAGQVSPQSVKQNGAAVSQERTGQDSLKDCQ